LNKAGETFFLVSSPYSPHNANIGAARQPISVPYLHYYVACYIVAPTSLSFRDEKSDINKRFKISACEIVGDICADSVGSISNATGRRSFQKSEGCPFRQSVLFGFFRKAHLYLCPYLHRDYFPK
jgi:hypothetical protein